MSQVYDGSPKTVTVTPKQGKSTGAITVYYSGSTTAPSAIGTYPITFDVAAASGWNAASDIYAGTLSIANQTANAQTPTANDFTIGNLTQTAGSVTAVTITPKQGKSEGQITIYYNGSTTIPQTAGTFTVTFDVAAALGWIAASGLSAGTLTIANQTANLQTPTENDFTIDNLTQSAGIVTAVTITPKQGKSEGQITIYYNGSTTIPQTAGTYSVSFDVGEATGWRAVTGLRAGELTVTARLPTFTSIADLGTWLAAQPANTSTTPYFVALNVSDLGGSASNNGSLGYVLRYYNTKYVNLNLSGSTITTIPSSAFGITLQVYPNYSGCDTLTGITIPNSVTSIGDGAFRSCTRLASVTIGNSVTSIGQQAFEGCTSLASITLPASVTSIGIQAFYNCTSLASVTIPNSVTSIGSSAFAGTRLASVTIPNSVTSIGNGAFRGCTRLASVTIGNGVKSIDGTFRGCTSLASVTIPNSVTSIGWAFEGCTSLASVIIPNSVTSIGDSAFRGCTSLASVTIPNSVTSIGDYAFTDCTSLASVTFQGTITTANFSSYSFQGDLRDKYLANGIGTYTTTSWPVMSSSVWTKR